MEASGAGLASGGDAATTDTSTGSDSQEGQGPTLADIHASMQQFGSDVESMREQLAQEPWRAPAAEQDTQQQTEPGADELDFSFLDETAPQYAGTPEAAMQQLGDVIRSTAQDIAAKELAPVKEAMEHEKQERGWNELSQDYPQLQDEQTAKELLDLTARFVETEGLPKEYALNPGVLRTVYLASRAQAQNQEGGDSAAVATLEGAGGASPGGAGQGDTQQQPTGAEYAQSLAPKRLGLFTGG